MMNDVIKIAVMALAESRDSVPRGGAVGRMSLTAIYAVGSGVAAVAGLGCIMAAVWVYARPIVGAGGGALIVAACVGALWLVLFLMTHNASTQPPTSSPLADLDTQTFMKEVWRAFEKNKGHTLLAAAIAGLIVGNILNKPQSDRS